DLTVTGVQTCALPIFDRLASRGSCQAPFTVANAVGIKFNPTKIGLPKRATISLQVVNPLGLADLALHGSNDVRGWGQIIPPDQRSEERRVGKECSAPW